MTLIDQIYCWQGHGNGFGNWESRCRLRIFQPHREATIVIVSDLGGDCGTSITNCADHLASLVVAEFELDPTTLIWIEQVPSSEAEFSHVVFDWTTTAYKTTKRVASLPRWSYLHPEQVEALIGQSLQEV